MRNERMRNLKLVIACVAALLIVTSISCRSDLKNLNQSNANQSAPAPAPEATTTKKSPKIKDQSKAEFLHSTAAHQVDANDLIKDCNYCHKRDSSEANRADVMVKHAAPRDTFQPYHDSCDKCHTEEDFTNGRPDRVSNPLCATCHTSAEGGILSIRDLEVYPPRQDEFGLAGFSSARKGFSHKDHTDPQKMGDDAGLAKCDTCHKMTGGVQASFPKHQECFSCHAHQAGQKLDQCGVCHIDKSAAVKYSPGMGTALSLYNFRHSSSHLRAASCDRCHKTTEPSSGLQVDIQQISTARGQRHSSSCWSCHAQAREPVCTKCHVGSLPF